MQPVHSADLEARLAFLRLASHYPEHPGCVRVVETHMSWVFVLDRHVYKLKKPVCLDEFDCRTLAQRQHLCHEELRLNRRLAPGVYLDVVALTFDPRLGLAIGGAGRPVDWLVRMRRLPTHRMLDDLLLHQRVTDADLRRLAARLAQFHLALPPGITDPQRYLMRFHRGICRDRRELIRTTYHLPAAQVLDICDRQLNVLAALSGPLAGRVRDGRVIEGHGDLRPEHICLGDEIAIIDCLEFSRALRMLDAIDELGFLALECERLGAPEVGARLLSLYSAMSGDTPAPELIHFYQSCRARIRARIAVRHLLEETHRAPRHWILKATAYLALADQHLARCR